MKFILIGADGAMGKTIQELVEESDHEIVAGFQIDPDEKSPFPLFNDFADLLDAKIEADAIIDFSTAKLSTDVVKYANEANLPLMLGTTGQNRSQLADIEKASQKVAILNANNTSIGVNIMEQTIAELTRKLYPLGYDVEIIEKHHRYKKDAPSGTAENLLKSVTDNMTDSADVNHGRTGVGEPRKHNDVGVHAIRGGDIVGEHTVIFANNEEVLEVTHRAGTKKLFAKGALTGAEFIVSAKAGLYDMKDVLEELQ